MVHPTELLRSDSNSDREFSAPLGDYRNDLDCGLNALPCLNKLLGLEKYAKPGVFVGVLALLGFLYGTLLSYFRATSHLWSKHYSISQDTIDWFVYTNEVFVGIFSLVVAYWGNRIHRVTWLGSLAIYLAVACTMLAVPEIYHPFQENETNIDVVTGPVLCQVTHQETSNIINIIHDEFKTVAFGILVIYQVLFALANISFISHGVSYIDDNISPKHSPGYIGLSLAANEIGKQVGIYLSWTPYIIKAQTIFLSPVWLVVASILFLAGCVMVMFPKVMPNVLIKKSVTSLLSLASGNVIAEHEQTVDGFFTSLWRVTKNKILLINIISVILIKSAIINFSMLEKFFNQSKYHIEKYDDSSGYTDATSIQFTSNLLRQPLVAISIVTSGMIIAKMRPSAKSLVIWNIIAFTLITILFASVRFLNCASKFKNELKNQLIIPYCSWSCGCSLDGPFQPICLNGETYFSPCIAGCTVFEPNSRVYQNCSCATSQSNLAIQGSCDAENCSTLFALAQVNSVIASGLLASTFVSTLIINMRSVSSKDKALALGMELKFLGMVPYLPIRLIYDAIADNYCQTYGKHTCQFYSENFGIFLSSATVTLMCLAIIFAGILLCLIGNLQIYSNISTPPILSNAESPENSELQVFRNNSVPEDSRQNPGESTALIHNSDVPNLRKKQLSEGRLNILSNRSSKEDRVNMYLSEGDLVPSLKQNSIRNGKTNSKNSNTSGISNDSSLNAIANNVGDDHDSDTFSGPSTLSRPLNNQLETSF